MAATAAPTEHEAIARWEDDLLPHIVDRLAEGRPDGVYSVWATAASGLRTVTYSQLANAVNGLAAWLVSELGPGNGADTGPEVLTYVGAQDVRYVVLLLAAVKAGYVLFLTSPRNSVAAHRSLFEQLKCKNLLTSDPVPPPVLPVINEIKPRHLIVPSVDELLIKRYPPFVLHKTFKEARWEPVVIIHTSGSTGTPKPVIYTHESLTRHVRSISRPTPGGIPSLDSLCRGKRIISMLPLFHGAGIAQHIFNAIPYGNIPIAVGAAAIPTAQDIVDTLKQTPADIAIAVPSVVAELAQSPELLDFCAARLQMILYIGGALPQAIGDRVAAKVQLRCQWGASEVSILQQLLPPELAERDNWSYTRFHPCAGAVFDEVANGGYELVIRRDEALAATQTVFASRIGIGAQPENEYRTKDIFTPHPTVPDAWQWSARADDIIVFLNGEKTNPVMMEQHIIARNPELRGVLVVGSQRIQAALLIEPASDAALTTAEQAALIERVWPSVEEANRTAPMHARIDKSLILVTPADRPPIRAGKGTLQRGSTVAQYAAEIDRLYTQADEVLDDDDEEKIAAPPTDAAGLAGVIREAVRAVTGWPAFEDADGFFDRGMDSLQALRLTRALRRTLGRQDLALSTIYQHPTVQALTGAVLLAHESWDAGAGAADRDRAEMEPLLTTYRRLIQEIPKPTVVGRKTERAADEPINLILTGSTGTVGTFLLHALLRRPGVGHVFCLNRRADAADVQRARLADAGLLLDNNNSPLDLAERVSFLQADLASPHLGLDPTAYETLRARASLVIHNAWPVNFNLPLAAFRPQLVALVNLFALAAGSVHPTRVLFVSSVSAVGANPAGAAPERVLADKADAAYPVGYARAKFLAEGLCEAASQHFGGVAGGGSVAAVDVAIARVGQVAGPVRRPGLWNTAEWFPSLVRTSAALGCLPDGLGVGFDAVDWVPVDVLADVLVDLAIKEGDANGVREGAAAVFNLRDPHPVPWKVLLPAVVDAIASDAAPPGTAIEVVSPATWLARLEEAAAKEPNVDTAARRLPALKLLGFFQELWAASGKNVPAASPMAIERALAASPALAALGPVEEGWMRKWVGEWMARDGDDGGSAGRRLPN